MTLLPPSYSHINKHKITNAQEHFCYKTEGATSENDTIRIDIYYLLIFSDPMVLVVFFKWIIVEYYDIFLSSCTPIRGMRVIF